MIKQRRFLSPSKRPVLRAGLDARPGPKTRRWVLFIRLGSRQENFMEKFVQRQNIARFTTLLMIETDTAKRELLQKLLTDRNGKTS